MSLPTTRRVESLPDLPPRFAVDADPPQFWPSKPGRVWSRLLSPVARLYAKLVWRVAEVRTVGLEEVFARVGPADGVLLAPNHSFEGDAHVMLTAAGRVGRRFHFMADWRAFRGLWGVRGWALQRMGVFSVDRDGADRRAVRHATDLLAGGRCVVIFPEGEIHHLNRRLLPLLEGVAFLAHSAQQQVTKAGGNGRVWVVPAAIQYRMAEDIRPQAAAALTRFEKRLFWARPPAGASLRDRLRFVGELLLTVKEKELLGRTNESGGDLGERIRALAEALLVRHEADCLKGRPGGRTMALRVKALRRCLLDRLTADGADDECRAKARAALGDVQTALQLCSYPGDYIASDDDQEGIAETIEKMHEDIFGTGLTLGRRSARVAFGEPIDMRALAGGGRTRAVVEQVTTDLEGRIATLLAQPWN